MRSLPFFHTSGKIGGKNNEAANLSSHEICSMTGEKGSRVHLGGDLPCISLFLALSH
jgi:hypothetical protein